MGKSNREKSAQVEVMKEQMKVMDRDTPMYTKYIERKDREIAFMKHKHTKAQVRLQQRCGPNINGAALLHHHTLFSPSVL